MPSAVSKQPWSEGYSFTSDLISPKTHSQPSIEQPNVHHLNELHLNTVKHELHDQEAHE